MLMTLSARFLLLGLLLGLLACTRSPETETKPVAPSTPAPEERRYNPAELASHPIMLSAREELDA